MTLITAHAGCDGTSPGSIGNLDAARDGRADCIEFDLRYYGGQVLLSHDPIDPHKLAEYVTLEHALTRLQDSAMRFNCDLKEETAFLPALRCFEEHGLSERLDFTGFYPLGHNDTAVGYRVFLNLENVPAMKGHEKPDSDTLRAATDWFCRERVRHPALAGINADYTALSMEQYTHLAEQEIPIMCWTVDLHAAIEELLHTHIYAITTNEVQFSIRARNRIQRVK